VGHETLDLRGTSREGLSDREIFAEAQAHQAVFLTTDRDFFHPIPHLHEQHSGVIVIALRQPNRKAILEKLAWTLRSLQPADLVNRTIQLRDKTWVAIPPVGSNS
jgi:predicted nuclease of predicted toxin-antitoxin system